MTDASQRFSVVSNELPDPPYPPDTEANGWHPQLHIGRIVASDTWLLADDDERPWLLRIWFEAWQSVPVGSMPSDRRLFARRIGCKPTFLDAHAEILLRGWVRHSDGLLYHGFIVGQVVGMLEKRRKGAEKVALWREDQKQKKQKQDNEQGKSVTGYNEPCNRNVPVSNRNVPVSNRQEGKGREYNPPTPLEGGSSGFVLPDGVDRTAWSEFEAHRREIRKPLTDLARAKNANILAAMTPEQQRISVDNTIRNRWTGVFEPKTKASGSGAIGSAATARFAGDI